jgi:hypothetical protein
MSSIAPALIDALGTRHEPAARDARIVCLVPSITELVCDLGLAHLLVARTGFCIHPREIVRRIPKVGGTKDVNLERVRALSPTHAVVNIDENEKPTVDELAKFVPNIVVTHPLAPADNPALYRLIGGIFGAEEEAERLCRSFQSSYSRLVEQCRSVRRETVLYLIWKDPWMTVSRETYISRMLASACWDTEPAAAAARYPKLELNGGILSRVDHVLLSSEPYPFRRRHVDALSASHPSVRLINGEMVSWYGSRAVAGLAYLRELRLRG